MFNQFDFSGFFFIQYMFFFTFFAFNLFESFSLRKFNINLVKKYELLKLNHVLVIPFNSFFDKVKYFGFKIILSLFILIPNLIFLFYSYIMFFNYNLFVFILILFLYSISLNYVFFIYFYGLKYKMIFSSKYIYFIDFPLSNFYLIKNRFLKYKNVKNYYFIDDKLILIFDLDFDNSSKDFFKNNFTLSDKFFSVTFSGISDTSKTSIRNVFSNKNIKEIK